MAALLDHPEIGEIQGKAGDGVTQFLGIQYATLRDRLAKAELVESYGRRGIDASKLG
jgi:hypothetical protein